MSTELNNLQDLASFDFTPAWAKKDAGVSVGRIKPERSDDRKPFGERKDGGTRPPRRDFGDRKGGFGGDRKGGERKGGFGGGRGPRRDFAERPKPLDVDVKVLPDPKALGTIIRKLQQDWHAYKLKDLAYFFLDNPSSVLLKITPKMTLDENGVAKPGAALGFTQCKACGFASSREEDVLEHIVTAHLGDYYDSKEIEVEPPKGNFNCVARCGLSGVLLGPPNIHEFNATVREMIRTKYPDMSEEQYRSHIEMVRDADAIEEWRKGATKRAVFFAKGSDPAAEGAAILTREQAEGEFRRTMLATLVDHPKALMITADVAVKSPVKPLVWAVNDALEQERRAPYAMCFALRGAFHHRKLNSFRTNDARGQEFMTGIAYREFDAAHAVPELAAVAKFVAENPCCDKNEIIAALGADAEKQLVWLATTGHVVAFTNGVFSPVEKFPKYGPQWRRRSAPAAAGAEVVGVSSSSSRMDGQEPKPEVEDEGEESKSKVEVEESTVTVVAEEKKDESTAVVAE